MSVFKRRKKLFIFLAIIVVSALFIIINIKQSSKDSGSGLFNFGSKKGFLVETETVARRDISSSVSATGYIQPLSKVNISPRISGEIVELHVKEGSNVNKGDLLLKLDSTQYEAALNQVKANYRMSKTAVLRAKASLEDARRECERTKSLYNEGVIAERQKESSELQLEIQKANHKTALEQVDQALADLEKARDNLERTVIRAPMAGIVSQLNVEQGEVVLGSISNLGTVMMTISDFNKMLVKADVEETNVVEIQKDQNVRIFVDALPEETFAGILSEIANTARQKGDISVFPVEVLVTSATDKLLPGMSADIEVITEEHKNVVAVPIQSVLQRKPAEIEKVKNSKDGDDNKAGDDSEGKNPEEEGPEQTKTPGDDSPGQLSGKSSKETVQVVYVFKDGKAIVKQVETGISDDTYMEIVSGISEGDQVIVGPYRNLENLKHNTDVHLKETLKKPSENEKKDETPVDAKTD